jgi:hypothetical protein
VYFAVFMYEGLTPTRITHITRLGLPLATAPASTSSGSWTTRPLPQKRESQPACRVTARLYLSVASRSSSRSASAVSCVSTSSFVNRVNFKLELRTTQHCARQTAARAQRRGSDAAGAATGACVTAHAQPFPYACRTLPSHARLAHCRRRPWGRACASGFGGGGGRRTSTSSALRSEPSTFCRHASASCTVSS